MGLSLTGGKNKSKKTEQQSFDQTSTTSLSPRAYGLLSGRMGELGSREYQRLDPNAYKDFENPYEDAVVGAATADIEASRAKAANQQRSEMAGAGAFGDKRRGIYEAELTGEYDRTLATTLAGLRSRGYEYSQGIAQGENTNANQYQAQLDALLNQLYGILGNETTTRASGSSRGTATTRGSEVGFRFTPYAK